ncbi:ribonuclease P protein component [Candidatus Synechococcus spongiarum]|uniref:Ribonuclease P protein component n=1 Tax=Candidatus Synechococcus spongiarum TaxID=431041 RepID=A0A165B1Q4_9SYNE|nr:ribonuclease P protein component [Candidatus Synechococcus spongiarum]SAY38342.1 Ribonuclease P protein component (EC 3.1.26.5) [Candidatus Synechococcus spongiarum]
MVLPRDHRLSGTRVFDRLYRTRARFHASNLTLRVGVPNLRHLKPGLMGPRIRAAVRHNGAAVDQQDLRFAVVVSRKVSKRAVIRNRLRRFLHHAFMKDVPRLRRGHWLLLSLKPGAAQRSEDKLLQEWNQLLGRSGLCCDYE